MLLTMFINIIVLPYKLLGCTNDIVYNGLY